VRSTFFYNGGFSYRGSFVVLNINYMFTIQQIKAAHAKVKSGADFPQYVKEIKDLGLTRYEFILSDGRTIYFGADGYSVEAPPIFPEQVINPSSSISALQHTIKIHQQGQTDFLTFCRMAAEAGVHHWEVNTGTMLCTYFNCDKQPMVAEPIPDAGY